MTKNERKTENLVREALRRLAYYDDTNDISVEEQKSNIESVKRLLKSASKSGQGGGGAPEFIISAPSSPDFLLVIECKASVKDHISTELDELLRGTPFKETPEQATKRTQRFAVDGVLHYAQTLSKEFNVIAVAVSGETKSSVMISSYLVAKGGARSQLCTKEKKGCGRPDSMVRLH